MGHVYLWNSAWCHFDQSNITDILPSLRSFARSLPGAWFNTWATAYGVSKWLGNRMPSYSISWKWKVWKWKVIGCFTKNWIHMICSQQQATSNICNFFLFHILVFLRYFVIKSKCVHIMNWSQTFANSITTFKTFLCVKYLWKYMNWSQIFVVKIQII